jgi:3-phenylpropionate/trans-cinnamate dioxygenase ferredoxin reductase component
MGESDMENKKYNYIIVGAGLAGCHAVEGIRSHDSKGSILLASGENYLPYDRPPLTKKLWFGKKKVEEIFVQPQQYFADNSVDVLLNIKAIRIDAINKTVIFNDGSCNYGKLLLATGGAPRRLNIEGGNLDEIYYYRYLDDFIRLKSKVHEGTKALVIGGGFIGSEIAAALNINKADVTMLMRGEYLVENIFPQNLGAAIQNDFVERGVKIFTRDNPVSIVRRNSHLVTRTSAGREISSDVVIVGIGIEPEAQLAKSAGLVVKDGIVVNEFLQTSSPDIYAAGDNAYFPYSVISRNMRVEHWDNAINQGKTAGMNMAGERIAYTYMPYFFSDLFDFGYEAVGMVSSKLKTFADWQKENNTGVVYYLEDSKVRGVMCCNVWDRVDAARELIKSNKQMTVPELQGAVH